MVVKIDPGAQVNTIPLSRYHTLYPNCLNKSRYPKAKILMPTNHTWMSHDGLLKPFLGHFITEVSHATEPRTYPVRFMSLKMPLILLTSSPMLLWRGWGLFSFRSLIWQPHIHLDQVAVQNSQWQEEDCQTSHLSGPYLQDRGVPHKQQPPQMTAVARGRPLFSTRVKRH